MDTKKLRQKILDLAIHGKLVPQDPNDEPASVLLERIREEKDRLIKEGKIKKSKSTASSDTSHYENVPFEVPEKWIWVNLDSICSKIVDGDHNPPPGEVSPTNYRMLSSKNINNNKLVDIEDCRYLSKQDWELCNSRTRLHKGDLLLTTVATLGRSCVIETDEPICFQRSVTVLTTLIYNKYLKLVFDSNYYQELMTDSAKGTAQKGFYINQVVQSFIPLPPLAEQNRIVSAIEKWMSLIDSMETNRMNILESIKLAKNRILDLAIHGKLVPQDANDEPASELLKRINPKAPASCDNPHYQEPYQIPSNWIWCRLNNICTKIVDGDHNPPVGSDKETPYMMLSSKNINNDSLVDINNCRYLTYENWKICNSRTKLTKGDILLTTVATLGRSCVYDSEIPFCFQRSVTVITTMINNYYLKFLFDSPYYQSLMNDSAKGTAQKGFYLNQLEQSVIPVPPMSEQLRIVSKIIELFSQLDMIEKSLQA